MEEEHSGSVDPELQESISSLVAALGGPDLTTNTYKLGDEALECLRDLRKWLQFYDAKFDRLDVSCAIANTTLISNDIPEILSLWESSLRKSNDKYLDRVALGCLELLVPLTWPIDIIGKECSEVKLSQIGFLKKAQILYKTKILTHTNHNVLKAILRIAAKQNLQSSYSDRDPFMDSVLTLACSFFRNLAAIDTTDDDDRSVTLTEYSKQKVLPFIVTLGASAGSKIDVQDVLIMETIYFLLRGIDFAKVYGVKDESGEVMQDLFKQNLKTLLEVENEMSRNKFKPTRHSRFGTMVSMNEGAPGDYVSISGQRGVGSMESTLTKITETKKWNKPKYRGVKDELDKTSYVPSAMPVNGDLDALKIVEQFSNNILDASFNPLFCKLRKLIDRQQQRIYQLKYLSSYCYLVGWFLGACQARSKSNKTQTDYALVGEVLNTASITTTLELLRKSLELGELRNTDFAHACMIAVREILTCVQGMSYSSIEQFRDAADGMRARLFYDDTWLNMLSLLPRTSKGKSIAYACETVAVTHVVLKSLEAYSKQYTVIYVKSKHASKYGDEVDYEELGEEEAQRKSIKVTNERKFSYEKFLMKYVNEQTLLTYENVLHNHRQVSQEIILNVFSFFRRTFAKTSAKAIFYRMSLMNLLLELTDDQKGLPKKSKVREIANEFLRYYIHKFVATASKLPSLHIQTNMVMTPADAFYYDHAGIDKVKFKPPKHEYTLKRSADKFNAEMRFAIVIAALIDSGKEGSLKWVEEQLLAIMQNPEEKMQGQYLTTDKDKIKMIHNDGLLRLLLRNMGLFVDTSIAQIRIPINVDELEFVEKVEWLTKYQNQAIDLEMGKVASDYITIEGEYESDDEGGDFLSLRNRLYDIGNGNENNANANKHVEDEDFLSMQERESGKDTALEDNNSKDDDKYENQASKRTHSSAFLVEENEEEVPNEISSFSRRKLVVDDDEEED